MNENSQLSAMKARLDALPVWNLGSLGQRRTVILTIDMNNGFVLEGALASPRVAAILPKTAAFLTACRERGMSIVGITDCHQPDAEEFASYPAHCLAGTAESQLVSELAGLPDRVLTKNSTNAFFAPGVQEALQGVETVVVTGCCTDICILQFALALRAAANQENRPLEIIVPRQLVETFDGPGHPGDWMGTTALISMLDNGILVVNYCEE